MVRLRGRAPRGQRLVAAAPHGHWKTTTLIGALSLEGVRCSMLLDGSVNRAAFEAFIESVLRPQLRADDIVVMDNLSSHKGPRVAQLIRAARAELVYLPPYSPDLNPIEQAFSKTKNGFRTLAARTIHQLWNSTQTILNTVSPSDARGYFTHCGYTLQEN